MEHLFHKTRWQFDEEEKVLRNLVACQFYNEALL